MGIYGKYTRLVTIFSITQMVAGVLMILLGIAHRVLVCSWITDIAFGFWIGLLVIVGGVIGYSSATTDNYNYIGAYLCLNSFTIIFAVLVIFCHSLAFVHFIHQIDIPTNTTIPTNNSTNTTVPKSTTRTNNTKKSSNSQSAENGSTSNTTAIPSNETMPACYTGQPWSDYENGARGLGLGASMIFVCFVELLMSIMSMAYCWAATKVQPTEIARKKVIVQGTVAEIISSTDFEMRPRRRRATHVTQVAYNVYDNMCNSSNGSQLTEESDGIENHTYETVTPTLTTPSLAAPKW